MLIFRSFGAIHNNFCGSFGSPAPPQLCKKRIIVSRHLLLGLCII